MESGCQRLPSLLDASVPLLLTTFGCFSDLIYRYAGRATKGRPGGKERVSDARWAVLIQGLTWRFPSSRSVKRTSIPHENSRLLGIVAAVAVIATLYFARVVFVPIALALPLSLVLSPLVAFLEKIKLPRVLAIFLVVVLAGLKHWRASSALDLRARCHTPPDAVPGLPPRRDARRPRKKTEARFRRVSW